MVGESHSMFLEPYVEAHCTDSIPFSLAQDASVLDMEIDWSSPFNRTGIGLSEGDCSAIPCPGRFILGATSDNLKPLQARALNLPAGRYNLRLDNYGPGAETIRYEVRMTPK